MTDFTTNYMLFYLVLAIFALAGAVLAYTFFKYGTPKIAVKKRI